VGITPYDKNQWWEEAGLEGAMPSLGVWEHTPSFTSPSKTSTDISAKSNISKTYNPQCLLAGQVPPTECGRLVGYVLNEISNAV